jgi:hypothetical protein
VIVCGGGPSLLEDLKQCEGEKIACNHHAHKIGLETEYLLYTAPIVEEYIKDYKGIVVNQKNFQGKKIRMFGYAGTAAVIFAIEHLRAEKVYITGCDLYTGPQKYCHHYDEKDGNEIKFKQNHPKWWFQTFDYLGLDNVRKLQPISGPLIELCERWCAAEVSVSRPISNDARQQRLRSV